MGMTADDYLKALQQLLPPGKAYSRELNGVMTDTLRALAQEFARIDARADALLDEADPRTTIELLADWERMLRPYEDSPLTINTVDARRCAVVAKLTEIGGQSKPYYIQLAAKLGFTITITEFKPFTCNTPIDQGIYDESARFTWKVNAPETTIIEATCQGSCCDPLRIWGNQRLETAIKKRNRASRTVIFSYGG